MTAKPVFTVSGAAVEGSAEGAAEGSVDGAVEGDAEGDAEGEVLDPQPAKSATAKTTTKSSARVFFICVLLDSLFI
jgi:hypothetical protein